MTIEITLNGSAFKCADNLNIEELVTELGIDVRSVAIERNLELAPKSTWQSIIVESGDKIELIQFVGGG